MYCEYPGCKNTNLSIGDSYSTVIVLQKVDSTSGYTFFQCNQSQTYNFGNWQHFCCSPGHRNIQIVDCINNHYTEAVLQPIQQGGGTTNIHKIVLGSNLNCKVCLSPLVNTAYRFCLTHATPETSVPDASLNDIGEWCCSLAHAQQSAISIVNS